MASISCHPTPGRCRHKGEERTHRSSGQMNVGHSRWSWSGDLRGSDYTNCSPAHDKGSGLTGPSIHPTSQSPAQDQAEPGGPPRLPGGLTVTPPSQQRRRGERLALLQPCPPLACRPSHSGVAGGRGRGHKLCANILPSPQDIVFNKRPWKCQLV